MKRVRKQHREKHGGGERAAELRPEEHPRMRGRRFRLQRSLHELDQRNRGRARADRDQDAAGGKRRRELAHRHQRVVEQILVDERDRRSSPTRRPAAGNTIKLIIACVCQLRGAEERGGAAASGEQLRDPVPRSAVVLRGLILEGQKREQQGQGAQRRQRSKTAAASSGAGLLRRRSRVPARRRRRCTGSSSRPSTASSSPASRSRAAAQPRSASGSCTGPEDPRPAMNSPGVHAAAASTDPMTNSDA